MIPFYPAFLNASCTKVQVLPVGIVVQCQVKAAAFWQQRGPW